MHRIELNTLTLIACAALGIDSCSGPHYLLSRCVEVVYGRRVSLSKLEIDRVRLRMFKLQVAGCRLQVTQIEVQVTI